MTKRKTIFICGGILLAGVLLSAIIFVTEPTATRVAATRETAMRVEVEQVQRGDFRPTIVALGTVEPVQDAILSPRVGGEVISKSPAFTPGGYVEKGALLLQIDPSDYRNTLRQRKSDLAQALADLDVEMGRQNVARKDYQLLDESLTAKFESLVLRKPQLGAAKARVDAARAAVDQAQLALDRTTIRAPFDAHILSRNVTVGSLVSAGDDLGRLVGLEAYWVATTVPLAKLPWLTFPRENGEIGSTVQVRNRVAWPDGVYRTGHLHRLVGALEEKTRMARVLVDVPDPLSRRAADAPPLMIGAFVEARIQARPIIDVVRLDRAHLRAGNTVWVMDAGQLSIRTVDIVFSDATHAYIRNGLSQGDRVVITNLATVKDGAPLRLKSELPNQPSDGGEG